MKQEFSPKWISSKQPRKQRKYRANAPLHLRHTMMAAHLDKILRKEHKKRSMAVRKGDEVVVVRGEFKKRTGKISEVSMKTYKIYVEGINRKKNNGQESLVAIDPSNVVIRRLNLDDKFRFKQPVKKDVRKKVA